MDERRYPCDHPVPIEQEPRHHLVLANDFVRAFAVEIAPHDRTLCHHHEHEYLMYVAGEAQIISAPRDSDPKTHTYHDGDCELSPPGLVHVVENLADTKFRNLLVEFLPGMAGLLSGFAPKIVTNRAKTVRLFAHDLTSVFLLDIETDSEVEIDGPAIVASPYENELEFDTPQEGVHTLVHYRDLRWLGFAMSSTLTNHAKAAARAVLITVGRR